MCHLIHLLIHEPAASTKTAESCILLDQQFCTMGSRVEIIAVVYLVCMPGLLTRFGQRSSTYKHQTNLEYTTYTFSLRYAEAKNKGTKKTTSKNRV